MNGFETVLVKDSWGTPYLTRRRVIDTDVPPRTFAERHAVVFVLLSWLLWARRAGKEWR